ncbi:MAG: protein translocase subunit SecD, partial [Planctomycetales bacterium]|nr:protein translocase subunit SecD [Planctomycetales bacterium]
MDGYLVPLLLLAIAVVAMLAGRYVAKSLRMPESGWKASLLVAVIGIAAMILYYGWPPKQGIDLKGGVILIYEIDKALTQQNAAEKADGDTSGDLTVDMPGLIQGLSRRINPGGLQEIVVRPNGPHQVEIIIPDVVSKEVDRIKELITTGGFLKFQLVANRRDHSHIWSLADEPEQVGQYEVRDASGQVVGQWAKLSLNERAKEGESPYRVDPFDSKSRVVRGRKEVLMVVDPNLSLQGSDLRTVRKGYQDLSPAVFFDMEVAGAAKMGALTEANLPDVTANHYSLLGIVMDGELISAPRINSTITSSGVIEGQFSDEEVDMLVNVLRAGRLPAVLKQEPVSQSEISPLLGNDTIREGKIAIAVSIVVVMVFMVIYYMYAGVVSCLALILNLGLILALMIFVGAAFSLPGMAALVLTVGMAVDASVLIYERIREEQTNGAAVRMAIRNGFDRATRTIVDANLTTLITAIVLYAIGTEQLKAFAVALILGILMTMFSAIFFSRFIFDVSEKVTRMKKVNMMNWFAQTDWDLFKKRHVCIGFSALLILISLIAVGVRNRRIFDIDFLGGTSVQMLLKEPMSIADVRTRVERLREDGIAQDVSVTQIKSEQRNERIYRIDTSLPNMSVSDATQEQIGSAIERVQQAIMDEFRSPNGELMLQTHRLNYTPPKSLTGASSSATSATTGATDTSDLPTVDAEINAGDATTNDAAAEPAADATPARTDG